MTMMGVLAAVAFAAAPAAGTPSESLQGIWVSETVFRASAPGELTVTRHGAEWSAALAGGETNFRVSGTEVRFGFADDLGKFRGTLSADDRSIEGFWLRPADKRDNAGGSGQAFASPLTLQRADRDTWRGTVRPLADTFTLYLKVFDDGKGNVLGAFRNPEVNSRGGISQFNVSRDGDTVKFSAKPDPGAPEIVRNATLLHSPERLRIEWRDLGRTLELVRRDPSEVPGFFPRPPGETKYVYEKPPALDDGWTTGRAADVGLDEAALSRLVQSLIDGDPASRRPSLVHSLLVAHHGKLVLEEYFFGFDRDTPHDIRSAGKTFGSVMVGAAMREGRKISPETSVYELLGGMGPFANPDPRKSKITLARLMTHTSGLDCNDNDDASLGNEETMQTQKGEPNWWKYTLDLPMVHEPGERYAYCSANANLTGAAITTATGTWLPEYFDRTIARPLKFGTYYWNLMPTGEGYLGGGSFMRPRDLLKIGQLYLNGGTWNGRRIVDASWTKRSTEPYVEVSPKTTGVDEETFKQSYIRGASGFTSDGYAWHLVGVRAGEHAYREYDASGNGGQLIIVVPELDLAVVITAGNYTQGGIWNRWRDQIVGGAIIPAIQR